MFALFAFCIALLSHYVGCDEEAVRLQRWDRVACIASPNKSNPKDGKIGSAFFVRSDNRLFIVTAGHASGETNDSTKLIYRDPSGKSQSESLASLLKLPGNPWDRDKVSDLAIAELSDEMNTKAYLQLLELSVPLEQVSTQSHERTTEIVTIGFPMGLGVKEPVSPLAHVGHIASQEIKADNDWGGEPIIFAIPAVAQGTSGGPTFLKNRPDEPDTVVGMYVGFVSDASGGKLSKLVPSRIIHAAIAKAIENSK